MSASVRLVRVRACSTVSPERLWRDEMGYGPYEQALVEVQDQILTLTLNRPDRLNAFTGTMMREMIDVFTKVNTDDGVRAIVVTGAGRAFCAGADLSGGADTFDASRNPARAERN